MARRKVQIRAVGRSVTFGPAALAPLAGWLYLGRPFNFGGHWEPTWRWLGLGAMETAGLILWPLAILALLFFLPEAARGGLVPRSWRIRYRETHGPRNTQRSSYISQRLRRVVYYADRYQCLSCRARLGIEADHLEVDHFRPWRWGGLTTLFNCTTLCPACNKIKLDYWRERNGYEHYARRYAVASSTQAAIIAARLRRRRLSPVRWLRAAWAVAI